MSEAPASPVSHVRSVQLSVDPVQLFERMSGTLGFILESGKGGRFTYLGRGDWERIEIFADGTAIKIDRNGEVTDRSDAPLDFLRDLLSTRSFRADRSLLNFRGGAVGYFSYDFARLLEDLPDESNSTFGIPVAQFFLPDRYIEIDHLTDQTNVVWITDESDEHHDRIVHDGTLWGSSIEELIMELGGSPSRVPSILESFPSLNRRHEDLDSIAELIPEESRAQFGANVQRAVEYIHAGDIFQVNLSMRAELPTTVDPVLLYDTLRHVNPAPYMALLQTPTFTSVGASPELLIKVDGAELSTRPIAGTRKRSSSAEEDERMGEVLRNDEKERAEHLMLVDLERNDIGRVAEFGSVTVDEFMALEYYSHVIHIVSNVRGTLREEFDTLDAICSLFPGGTITGAPKIRSMEIIEELEQVRRELYTGSVGWIGFDGDAEFNIAIRTIMLHDGIAYVQAGAGIVADSVPAHEFRESLRKMHASVLAVETAELINSMLEGSE